VPDTMNNRPKILIVDDRVVNLITLEVILEDLEVDLIRAQSGNEANEAPSNPDDRISKKTERRANSGRGR
jgi:response regulator RpfG family c-di-GMP phosphodiesterase